MRGILLFQRQKHSFLLLFFLFFFPGGAATARLNKTQKKKRCIFIMATVSKAPTWIYVFFALPGNEKYNWGFCFFPEIILLLIYKRIQIILLFSKSPSAPAPSLTENRVQTWELEQFLFAPSYSCLHILFPGWSKQMQTECLQWISLTSHFVLFHGAGIHSATQDAFNFAWLACHSSQCVLWVRLYRIPVVNLCSAPASPQLAVRTGPTATFCFGCLCKTWGINVHFLLLGSSQKCHINDCKVVWINEPPWWCWKVHIAITVSPLVPSKPASEKPSLIKCCGICGCVTVKCLLGWKRQTYLEQKSDFH